jgi:hypothetical protein
MVGPAELEVYKKAAESNQWTVLSKPTTTYAIYSATAKIRREHNSHRRLADDAEIGRKPSPSLKRPMSSLMNKAYGKVRVWLAMRPVTASKTDTIGPRVAIPIKDSLRR